MGPPDRDDGRPSSRRASLDPYHVSERGGDSWNSRRLEYLAAGTAHGLARTKVLGIRVAVDGSYLGPHETGTQVSILATVEA